MFKPFIAACLIAALASGLQAQTMDHARMDHAAHMNQAASAQRQAQVAERGKDVMPFSLAATTHIFTKTAEGGVQQVVATRGEDEAQVKLVRQHLQEIREQFLKRNFSGPSHIHGQDMPGLAGLRAARPGQITIDYKAVEGGAELSYKTADAGLVASLHKWFDAQLSDHGKDAMAGHHNHGDVARPGVPK